MSNSVIHCKFHMDPYKLDDHSHSYEFLIIMKNVLIIEILRHNYEIHHELYNCGLFTVCPVLFIIILFSSCS